MVDKKKVELYEEGDYFLIVTYRNEDSFVNKETKINTESFVGSPMVCNSVSIYSQHKDDFCCSLYPSISNFQEPK